MALLTFKGGIHPDDGKRLAKDKAIVDVKPTGDLVYPVSQHIGAPANPIVAVGDHVLKGQMIAEAGGFVSAPIYASVSGTVKAIAPHLNPTGGTVNSIVIEALFVPAIAIKLIAHVPIGNRLLAELANI